jgi:hypothetical protein
LRNSVATLAQEFPQARILPFSAKTSAGREELWREIRAAVENFRAGVSGDGESLGNGN